MKKLKKFSWLLLIPAFLAVVAGLAAVVMWLWNAILPDLLNVGSISFWQALGLLVLCKILFGGFGCGGEKKKSGPPSHFHKKWRKMNNEERQKFKEEWKNRRQCHS